MEAKAVVSESLSYWQENLSKLSFANGTNLSYENHVKLLVDGEEFFPAYIQEIDNAEKTLSFQFLNMEADDGGRPIADALIRAAKRGVIVKGILDHLDMIFETNGAITILPWQGEDRAAIKKERRATQEMFREMKSAGIELYITLPSFRNGFTRNHRKSVIADQRSMIIGGFNPTGHNLRWHEVCLYLEGEVAKEGEKIFNQAFSEYSSTPMPMIGSTNHVQGTTTIGLAVNDPRSGESIRSSFVDLVSKAKKKVQIENAYFNDPACFQALIEALRRGVKVELIVPKVSNHVSVDQKRDRYFPQFVREGGEVFLYRGMTHAKLFLIDEEILSLGSSNFTPLNIWLERELNAVTFQPNHELAREVSKRVFDVDRLYSDRYNLSHS